GAIMAYFVGRGRYAFRDCPWGELRTLVGAGLAAAAFEIAVGALTANESGSVPAIAAIALFSAYAWTGNWLAKQAVVNWRLWSVAAVIIGEQEGAGDAQSAIKGNLSLGYRIVARVDPATLLSSSESPRLQALLARYRAKFLFIACSDPQRQRALVETAL